MKIGILRTGRALPEIKAAHGEFDTLFETLLADPEFTFSSFAVLDGDFPRNTNECDAWLITGSAFSSYEDLPWISQLEMFIRDAFAAEVPMVGVCFGHQIMAQALGGKVEKYKEGWALGPHTYDFDGISDPVTINAWHQDQVTRLPYEARTVGRSDFCENAAIVYGKSGYSVQAHPEFNNAFIGDLINLRRDTVPTERVDKAENELTSSAPSPQVVEQIKAFFKDRKLEINDIANAL